MKGFIIIFILLNLLTHTYSQNQRNTNYWMQIEGSLPISKKVTLSQAFSARNRNMVFRYQLFGETYLKYKIKKGFRAGIGFRTSTGENQERRLLRAQRFFADLRWSHKIKKGLKLKYRSKWQVEYYQKLKQTRTDITLFAWRHKFMLDQKIKKGLRGSIGGEILLFENPSFFVSEYRLISKLKIKCSRNIDLSLSYFLSKQYRLDMDRLNQTLSVSMCYNFKKRKK